MRFIWYLLILFSLISFGQTNTFLEDLTNQCEAKKNKGEYKKLIQIASLGLSKSDNNFYQSKFNFYSSRSIAMKLLIYDGIIIKVTRYILLLSASVK